MKKVKLLRIILFIDIFLWAFIVFQMSNQVGEESSNLSRIVTQFFVKKEEYVNMVEPYVRKIAHYTEYAFGGSLFLSLLNTYNWTDRRKIVTSILLGVWYASLDEIHQLMVLARSGSIKDVCLDSLGIATGVFGMMIVLRVFSILYQLYQKNELKNNNEK